MHKYLSNAAGLFHLCRENITKHLWCLSQHICHSPPPPPDLSVPPSFLASFHPSTPLHPATHMSLSVLLHAHPHPQLPFFSPAVHQMACPCTYRSTEVGRTIACVAGGWQQGGVLQREREGEREAGTICFPVLIPQSCLRVVMLFTCNVNFRVELLQINFKIDLL